MSEQAKALVRSYFDAVNGHDTSKWDSILADDYVHHDPNLPVPEADRETHKQIIGGMLAAMSDMTIHIHDMVSEGDRVFVRWDFTGTHDGELAGPQPLPATGKSVEVQNMSEHRISGDRIAEAWVNFDLMTFLTQVGAIPSPG